MAPISLPPGFRFHPTDEELVAYYLDRKISGRFIELDIIPEVDLYKCEPWDLPDKSLLPSKDMEWYFYSPRDRKYPNGSRTNRATRAGYWKATGKDRPVYSQKRSVGMKKTLVYYKGRAPHGIRTNWVMHEYRLTESAPGAASSSLKDSYSLCRVFKKTMEIPKRKEEDQQAQNNAKLRDDSGGVEISKEIETAEEKVFNHDNPNSSSDLTQGTPIETAAVDDFQAQFACDEANSVANSYAIPMEYTSNLFQDTELPIYGGLRYQFPYPPLELEDFPQINFAETKSMKTEMPTDECMLYDKHRASMNGTLEEIIALCSAQDNSLALSMLD